MSGTETGSKKAKEMKVSSAPCPRNRLLSQAQAQTGRNPQSATRTMASLIAEGYEPQTVQIFKDKIWMRKDIAGEPGFHLRPRPHRLPAFDAYRETRYDQITCTPHNDTRRRQSRTRIARLLSRGGRRRACRRGVGRPLRRYFFFRLPPCGGGRRAKRGGRRVSFLAESTPLPDPRRKGGGVARRLPLRSPPRPRPTPRPWRRARR